MIATNNGGMPWRGTATGAELERAREGWRRGGTTLAALRLVEDRATREAIEAQIESGLGLVTDGLVRREDPTGYLVTHLGGMRPGEVRPGFPGDGGPYTVPVVESEVSFGAPILLEDFLFAREGTTAPVKIVLTGPYTLAKLADDGAYGDPLMLAMALAAALNQEIRALQSAGAPFIQINEPSLLDQQDEFPLFTRIWEVLGRGISTALGLHLPGAAADGLYPGIARLKRLACLSLDCVAGRATIDLLRSVPPPPELRISLGVVDGSLAGVDTTEAVVSRVGPLEGLPPHDRLLLGTAADLDRLPADTARARLRALAGAARRLGGDAPDA